MFTLTKNSVVEPYQEHRCILCRLEESSLMVDSMVQAYMSSWFINPKATGGPG